MKTIEEKAIHIAREFSLSKANKESAIYRACIRMAEEQKQIDIDKAWRWIENTLFISNSDIWEESFREVMEL